MQSAVRYLRMTIVESRLSDDNLPSHDLDPARGLFLGAQTALGPIHIEIYMAIGQEVSRRTG